MGIVEEFEGLVTGADDGRDDPQILQPIDIGLETAKQRRRRRGKHERRRNAPKVVRKADGATPPKPPPLNELG